MQPALAGHVFVPVPGLGESDHICGVNADPPLAQNSGMEKEHMAKRTHGTENSLGQAHGAFVSLNLADLLQCFILTAMFSISDGYFVVVLCLSSCSVDSFLFLFYLSIFLTILRCSKAFFLEVSSVCKALVCSECCCSVCCSDLSLHMGSFVLGGP